MKGLITVLAVLVVVLLAYFLYRTPSAPREMTEAEVAAVEEAVLAQANALIETQNALDADGFLAQFSTDDLDWINQSTHFASYYGGHEIPSAAA